MKNKALLFLFIVLVFSCSKEEDGIAGVDDFSGQFRLSHTTAANNCTNSTSTSDSTSSENDLEIYDNGRFRQKLYELNTNGECVVAQILEGQITITSSFYGSPRGTFVYDISDGTVGTFILLTPSVDGKHNEITLEQKSQEGIVIATYSYGRTF